MVIQLNILVFFLKAINYKDNKIFLKNAKIINDIDVIV